MVRISANQLDRRIQKLESGVVAQRETHVIIVSFNDAATEHPPLCQPNGAGSSQEKRIVMNPAGEHSPIVIFSD